VKQGFEPIMPGYRHVPYNDLQAVADAISPATVAVLIEGIQGEGGITPATPEYLLGLRKLCDEKNLLLMIDAVQCGHFRSGRFQSYQRALEGVPGGESFVPDAISMAKSLGGGFPIGAFWVKQEHADLLGPGTHGTTFGGTPLGCAVALKIFEVIERDNLQDNIRQLGDWWMTQLNALKDEFPNIIKTVRGVGFMIGIELADNIPAYANSGKAPSLLMVNALHVAGMLTIPSGLYVFRLLPPYNLKQREAEEGMGLIRTEVEKLAKT
jgi:acetylornithine/N-succinyldiaminopimelate aminotransferase